MVVETVQDGGRGNLDRVCIVAAIAASDTRWAQTPATATSFVAITWTHARLDAIAVDAQLERSLWRTTVMIIVTTWNPKHPTVCYLHKTVI